MCNHYRHAILGGETVPGCSIDQFSEINVPLYFHSMEPDVLPDREVLVVSRANDLVFASIQYPHSETASIETAMLAAANKMKRQPAP